MDCRTAEKLMDKFLDRSLEGEDLRLFIKHVNSCPVCEEELGTSYLLNVALPRIEDGQSVNLKDELTNRLDTSNRFNELHWAASNVFRSIEVAAGIALSLSVVRVFVMYVIPRLNF